MAKLRSSTNKVQSLILKFQILISLYSDFCHNQILIKPMQVKTTNIFTAGMWKFIIWAEPFECKALSGMAIFILIN